MTDKPLTRRQIEALEAVYHGGYPWMGCAQGKTWNHGATANAGGAINRMVDMLRRREYFDRNDVGSYVLTVKGYAALSESKAAMKFIDEAELAERWAARMTEEAAQQAAVDAERRQRAERRRIAEETSRRERLAKLRELKIGHNVVFSGRYHDDELLDIAARVHEIMEVY